MKYLIIVDFQNDFINGSLGSKEATALLGPMSERIEKAKNDGETIIFTKDTHYSDYMNTFEGKHLPIWHCQKDSDGWEIPISTEGCKVVEKDTFEFTGWKELFYNEYLDANPEEIEICGLCTDICVISNALALRTIFRESPIFVNSNLCAGTSPENHEAALKVMQACQIDRR